MLRKLRDRLKAARQKLWDLIRKRHDAKPGGDRREKLAHEVREARRRKDKIAKRIKEYQRRKPDWNGHTPVLGVIGENIVRAANAHGLLVTSTTDGQHATTSYHYQARAIDFGVGGALIGTYEARVREVGFQRWLAENYPNAREIFGPDSYYVKNGVRYPGAFPDHGDHVHVAI